MVIVFPSIIYEMSHNSTEEEPLGLNISCKNPHNFTRIEVDLSSGPHLHTNNNFFTFTLFFTTLVNLSDSVC